MSSAGETVESLIIALIMALIIKTSIVEAYKIPSSSMEDTLLIGDFLLANKFVYGMQLPIPFVDIKLPAIEDPKPGDIIIFKNPNQLNQNYIKRCIAVEGQTIEIKEKRVFIDGKLKELPEDAKFTDGRMIPFHSGQPWGQRDNMPLTTVPEGHLFVMGDNRDNSHDSRFWGFLDKDLVMGRALIIHWSWRPDEDSPGLGGFFSVINWIGYNIWHFPERVRWGRLAMPIT
jgi:signal peptidase I